MKKEIAFIAVMMILGIAIGLGAMIIFSAVSIPNQTNLLLTLTEKADYELMQKNLSWTIKPETQNIVLSILLVLIVTTLILFILNLNPNIKNAFRRKGGILKALSVILISIIWAYMLFFPVNKFSEFGPMRPDTAMFFLFTFITGLLWLISGEIGWAGDFSSWRMGVPGKPAKPLQGFIMGAVTGSAVYGLFTVMNWALGKYFILVTEVLDKSGMSSFLGYKLLGYGMMLLLSLSLGIIAGLALALSPTYRTVKQRLLRLIFPAVVFAVMNAIVIGIYNDADRKYDLGKKDIREAVGIPDKASSSRTILLFKGKKQDGISIQEWHLQVSGYGVLTRSTIELSYENLKKIEDYLKAHKEGSIFNNVAEDVLYKGYYALWDIEKAEEMQFASSGRIIFARLMMLNRLQYTPITQKNLEYLKAYADESRWYAGGKSSLSIAKAFIHFGMPNEADAWLKKAKERGADVSEVKMIEKALTGGRIKGRITLNGGKPLLNTKVAILKYQDTIEKIEEWTLPSKLIDVRQLDSKGVFAFDNLGDGQYLLTIMTDKETIPYSIPSENLKVKNPPGVLNLGGKISSLNLGDIDISY